MIENKIDVSDEIIMKPISEIKPYTRNPRTNSKTIDELVKIIPKVGFNVPLVIDEKGIIVKGHARFAAAVRLGMKELPCIITHADEDAIKADRITDNKISELSEWVNDELLEQLKDIKLDIDFDGLGFPNPNIDSVNIHEQAEETAKENTELSDTQVENLYKEFEKRQAEEQATGAQETEEQPLHRPQKYYKAVCPHCGHITFIKAEELEDGSHQVYE